LAQGFDVFDDHVSITAESYTGERLEAKTGVYFDERPAARVNDAILPWLSEQAEKPFMAWIHYWDAHRPHIPPEPFSQLFHDDLYQGEIAYVDQSLGAVIQRLKDLGVYDRTLIVVTADHGEGRGDHHEETHSLLTYQTTLHVPLILHVPGRSGGHRITERVGTVDVLPTVLDLLKLEAPAEVQGRTLVPLLRGKGADLSNRQPYYAETLTPRLSHAWGELRVLYGGQYKYIHGPRPELFDLESDPEEIHDLIADRPAVHTRMHEALRVFLAENASDTAGGAILDADDETRQRLAALGYLSTGGETAESVQEVLRSDGVPPQDRSSFTALEGILRQSISVEDYLAAKTAATQLMELDPKKTFYRAMLARAMLGLGQLEAAAGLFEEFGAELGWQHPEVFQQVARSLANAKRPGWALKLARQILAEYDSAVGYHVTGEMLCRMQDYPGCQQALERSLELDSSLRRARLDLAVLQLRLGDPEASEATFETLVDEHPLYARGHFNYAVLLLQAKRWEDALRHLDRSVGIRSDYWQAHLARLTATIALGRREEAGSVMQLLESCPDVQIRRKARQLFEGLHG